VGVECLYSGASFEQHACGHMPCCPMLFLSTHLAATLHTEQHQCSCSLPLHLTPAVSSARAPHTPPPARQATERSELSEAEMKEKVLTYVGAGGKV
jgi:hypothetical protein